MALDDLTQAILAFNAQLRDLPDGPIPLSEDSERLNDSTLAQLQNAVQQGVDNHINSTGNAHGTAPSDLGGVSRSAVDARFAQVARPGVLPVDILFKDQLNVTTSGWTYTLQDTALFTWFSSPAVLATVAFDPAAGASDTVDLSEAFPDWHRNRVFEVYAQIYNVNEPIKRAKLLVTTAYVAWDTRLLHIGTIETNEEGIINITLNDAIRLAGFYLSHTERSNSIPVSTSGFFADPATHWYTL